MKTRMRIAFCLCLSLFALSARGHCAPGPLSLFANEGKHLFSQRLFNRSGNPTDLSRPLLLLSESDRVLKFDSTYEDIHRLEKNGVRVSSISSRGKKVFFLYPFEREQGKGTTVASFDRYSATLRFFNRSGLDDTSGLVRENGSAVSLARRNGRLLLGVHRGTATMRGNGVSAEINNRADILDDDAVTSISLKEQRRAWAAGYRYGKYEVTWQKNRFETPVALSVADADTELRLPVVSAGDSFEGGLGVRLSPNRDLRAFYGEGEADSFDINRYHVSNPANPNVFANLSNSKFRNMGIGVMGRISKHNSLRLEFEEYTGSLMSAGVLDYTNVISGLFGTNYILRANGDIHYSVFRLHVLRSGSRFSKALSYSLMPFNADFSFFSCEAGFGACMANTDRLEEFHYRDSRIHTLALGLRMKIGEGKSVEYSITQLVPQINRVEAAAPAAPPGPPAAPETKKERGGTTHFISLEFRF